MSVSLTEPQVLARTKTVTRRVGWLMLKPGDRLTLCQKVMGRRKGEPLVRICDVEVVSVRREPLDRIDAADLEAEGFPERTAAEFVTFFCATHKGCTAATVVTRIEWRYVGFFYEAAWTGACCCGAFTSDEGGCACSARKDTA